MTTVTGEVRDQSGDLLAGARVFLMQRNVGRLLGTDVTGDGSTVDSSYSSVSALLHLDGSHESTVLTDSGPNELSVTCVGGAKLTADDRVFGVSSLLCGTTGDYIYFPVSSVFEFGSGDFTVELFLKTTSAVTYGCVMGRDTGGFDDGSWVLLLNGNGSGSIQFWLRNYSGGVQLLQSSASAAINDGNWNHIALVRNGSAFGLYKNGTSIASGTFSGAITTLSESIRVCSDKGYSRDIVAGVDEIRITKGVARYTAGFTAPSDPFPVAPAVPLGQYSIDTSYSGEVQRIICAPDAWDPVANDLIDRIILP